MLNLRHACILSALLTAATPVEASEDAFDFDAISLEELTSMEVTTASKRSERVTDTASAIFVITSDDIRRSGHTTIPEALRLVPGLHVERLNDAEYALSIRGFQTLLANKLLVLIDGRSVYTTLLSGVLWDEQSLPIEEVDRIEVIRGPGATIWGANAVNGVINIITRRPDPEMGSRLYLRSGNQEQLTAALEHSFSLGAQATGRIAAAVRHSGPNQNQTGRSAFDDSRRERLGSSFDWTPNERDSVKVNLDWFHAAVGSRVQTFRSDFSDTSGTLVSAPANIRATSGSAVWKRKVSETSSTSFLASFARNQRTSPLIDSTERTLDLGVEHTLDFENRHKIVIGAGARRFDARVSNNNFLGFTKQNPTLALYHGFAQDQITLSDALSLTIGSKVSWNDYTGWELQPSGRLLWKASSNQRVWASVSRAVRTPAVADRRSTVTAAVVTIPSPPINVPIRLRGSERIESEVLIAYELGYRAVFGQALSLDLALFSNDYENLVAPNSSLVQTNRGEERSYGTELSFNWFPMDEMRVRGSWSSIHLHGSDRTPFQNWQLHASYTPMSSVELDLGVYYEGRRSFVDPSTMQTTKKSGSVRTDARVTWTPRDGVSLALVGQNLFDRERVESVFINNPSLVVDIQRSVFLELSLAF